MANQEHVDILKQGVNAWNQWRREYPDLRPDLVNADLSNADLSNVNLSEGIFTGANLSRTCLVRANLSNSFLINTNLQSADISSGFVDDADLWRANLREANLSNTRFWGARLSRADLTGADLTRVDLTQATLVETNLTRAKLVDCFVYGLSAWNIQLDGAKQENLVITPHGIPRITVDNLEVAQFIYLLLNNQKIRDVIDTITSKVVLILGRFISERMEILDAIRNELRKRDYLPVLFDFEKPSSRDITETVSTLAHLARFVIADITDAKSIPQELMLIVPNLPSLPVQPLILESQHEYGMFEHFTRYPWVLPVYRYTDEPSLLQSLKENVIEPAEQKAQDLAKQ